jgi:hypothetical protein
MEDYLTRLNIERDYDGMLKLLTEMDNVKLVNDYYKGKMNTRVILSSFMLNNFNDYFLLDSDSEIIKSSKTIVRQLLNKDDPVTEYERFHNLFVQWRNEDIEGMKTEIDGARSQLENMVLEETRDDADEQWNEGVKINMKLMDNTKKLLNKYESSPPPF